MTVKELIITLLEFDNLDLEVVVKVANGWIEGATDEIITDVRLQPDKDRLILIPAD